MAVIIVSALKSKDKDFEDVRRVYIETKIPVSTAIKHFKNTYPFSKMDYNEKYQMFSYYSGMEAFMYGITFPL